MLGYTHTHTQQMSLHDLSAHIHHQDIPPDASFLCAAFSCPYVLVVWQAETWHPARELWQKRWIDSSACSVTATTWRKFMTWTELSRTWTQTIPFPALCLQVLLLGLGRRGRASEPWALSARRMLRWMFSSRRRADGMSLHCRIPSCHHIACHASAAEDELLSTSPQLSHWC